MTILRLKHVYRFKDRHGKVRQYLRLPGQKAIPLPGKPGSPEFMEAYQAGIAAVKPAEPGATRTVPGSLDALAVSYFASAAYKGLGATTQVVYRRLIDEVRKKHGPKPVRLLDPSGIRRLMEEKSDHPTAANHRLRMLRILTAHAIDLGWRDTDPTHGVKRQRHKAVGYATWSEDEIAAYEVRWPSGSRERLAFALLLYTGQRRSDVVRMGWPQVRNEAIDLKQVKTGTALAIPIHPDLATELTFTPRDQPTFLQRQNGAAFTANGFYMRFIGWCEKAGIPQGRSPHGLRKAAARRLAEAGCTAHQIAAITGHRSLSEVERYTKAADQVRLATAAMARITRSKLQTPKEKLQTEDENGG